MSKKIYLLTMAMAVVLLSALGFASCVSETETFEGDPSAIVTRSVTFSIKLPSGDAVHVTRALQDEDEYAVNSLWLLVFDAADDVLIHKENIVSSLTGAAMNGDGNTYNYTYEQGDDDDAQSSAVRIMLVANDDMSDLTELTTTRGDLANREIQNAMTASFNQATAFTNSGLPMYGVVKAAGGQEIIPLTTAGANQAVSVTMQRCVARVDLYNKVDGLTIKTITMKQLNSTCYLSPHASNGVRADVDRVSGVTAFAPLADPWLVGNSTTATSNLKSFYLYEEQAKAAAGAAEVPILQIEGELTGGIPVYYEIPFTEDYYSDASGTAGTRMAIARNTLYKVEISGTANTNSRSNITISSQAWPDFVETPLTAGNDPLVGEDNYTLDTRTFTAANTAHTETIKKADGMTATITGVQVMADGDDDWTDLQTVAATNVSSGAGNWLSAQFADGGATATITLTANEGAARVGSVRVRYTNWASQTKYMVFTVNQVAAD